MLWNKILSLFLGSTFLIVKTVPQEMKQARIDEIQSYDCARSVAALYSGDLTLGPLFERQGLVFTSVPTSGAANLLIVNAGAGTFAVNLPRLGVNKVRFDLPRINAAGPKSYFISYMHGALNGSRVFEFGVDRPAPGHDDLEYLTLKAERADHLLPHFEYAILSTMQRTFASLVSGRIEKKEIRFQSPQKCEHLTRRAPQLASNLRHHFDAIDSMIYRPRPKKTQIAQWKPGAGRGPASN